MYRSRSVGVSLKPGSIPPPIGSERSMSGLSAPLIRAKAIMRLSTWRLNLGQSSRQRRRPTFCGLRVPVRRQAPHGSVAGAVDKHPLSPGHLAVGHGLSSGRLSVLKNVQRSRAKAISRKDVPRLSLPPAGGGEVGGSGAGRGTRARRVCLGFPPPTSPRWGEARSRVLAPRAPSGMFFCRNRLSAPLQK